MQIKVGRRASARRKLHALARGTSLGVRELAEVIGVEYMTIRNHLDGRKIARSRVDWYHRLEAIDVHSDGYVCLLIRYRPTRKRWGWKLNAAQRRAIFSAVVAASRITSH